MVTFVQAGGSRLYVPPAYANRVGDARIAYVPRSNFSPGATVDPEVQVLRGTLIVFPALSAEADKFVQFAPQKIDAAEAQAPGVRLALFQANGALRGDEIVRTDQHGRVQIATVLSVGAPAEILSADWTSKIPVGSQVVAQNGQMLIDLTAIADPAGLYLDANFSTLAEIPAGSGRKIAIDIDGPARGTLRFPLSLNDRLLAALGVGPRYFVAESITLNKTLRPSRLSYPLYALGESTSRVFTVELDFAAPHQTEMALTGGIEGRPRGMLLPPTEPLRTHIHVAHGHEVELAPVAPDDGFALTPSPLAIVATEDGAQVRGSSHYFTPFGAFHISMRGGNPVLARLTLGLSNLETIDVAPQSNAGGSKVLFTRRQAAFSVVSDRSAPAPHEKEAFATLSSLHDTCHTSWFKVLGGDNDEGSTPLSLQPEGMQSYRRFGGEAAFRFDAQRYPRPLNPFPFVPLLGLRPTAGDAAAKASARRHLMFERDIIAKVRRVQIAAGIADHLADAPVVADDVRPAARTPQGYAVERSSTTGPWTKLTFTATSRRPELRNGEWEYPGLTAVGFAAKDGDSVRLLSDALSHNRLFLVTTWKKLAALGFDLTVFGTMHLGGWAINIQPDQATLGIQPPPDSIIILKYDDRALRDLASDTNRWTLGNEFANGAPSDLQRRLLKLLPPPQSGDELLRPLAKRADDPNWNGLLLLDARLPLDGIPAQMRAIAAGLPSLLPVSYAGIDISGIEPNQPANKAWPSAIFGLIRYDNNKASWSDPSSGVAMRVPRLIVRVENDAIERFECNVELKVGQLFDVESANPQDELKIEGQYESRVTEDGRKQDNYSFAARDVFKKTFAETSVVKEVEFRQIKLITVATDGVATRGRFLIDGKITFNKISDFDLLSIDGIDFSDFAIDLTFGTGPIKFDFNYPNLRFDLDRFNRGFGRRLGSSLLSRLPFKLRGFRIGDFKLPSLGYIGLGGIKLGDAFEISNNFKYGFDFDLDLGSLGALAKKLERFKLQLAIGWKPPFPGGNLKNLFAAGFRLDLGEGAGGIDLGLQGILRITADRFNLKKEGEIIILSADDCRLEVLGKRLPTKDSQHFSLFLFANIGGDQVFERPGWYASFRDTEPEHPIAIKNVVVAQRVDVRLDDVTSTRRALTWLEEQERFEGPNAAKKFVAFASSGRVLHYDPNREWFIALRGDFFRVFRLGLLLKDPDLYGAYVGLMRDEDPDNAFMSFDLLYQKLADGLGRYSVEVGLPLALRTFEVGAASVTIGLVRIDIYTDGGFLVDLGFPQQVDYSRSFVVQAGIFIGKGGMYIGRAPAITVPNVPAGYDQVFCAGFAMRIGLGREFEKGPIRAGLSVSVFGRVEGFLAARTTSDAKIAPDPYWLRVEGEIGIIAEIEGYVDLRLIRARLLIRLWIATGIVLQTRLPVLLYCEAGVSVAIEFEIGSFRFFRKRIRITIMLSYSTTLQFEWTLPARVPALPFGDQPLMAEPLRDAVPLWTVPELAQLGLAAQPLDLRFGFDLTRATRNGQPVVVLVPSVMWMQGDAHNMDGDQPIPPFAQLAKGLIAWAALQQRPGATNAQDILIAKGIPPDQSGNPLDVSTLEQVLRGFDAVPFDRLAGFLARLLAGSVLAPVDEVVGDAWVFPVPPGLHLRLTPTGDSAHDIDYAQLGKISDTNAAALLSHIDEQFAELDARQRLAADPSAAGDEHPLVSHIFRNWCEALALTAIEVAQTLWNTAGGAGACEKLSEVLEKISAKRWEEIAARAGRILLGGIRVPDQTGFSPLLQRAGLMIDLPLGAVSKVEIVGVGGSWLGIGAGTLVIDGPRLAGLSTATVTPQTLPPEMPPAARLMPRVFPQPPFRRMRETEQSGVTALLCPLGEDLRLHLGDTRIAELAFTARRQGGADGQFELDETRLQRPRQSMVFEMAVQRIAIGDEGGKRFQVENAFQIAGTSEAERRPLDALFSRPEAVSASLSGSELRLAWRAGKSDDRHPLYISPPLPDPSAALVVRATVSIERRPFPSLADAMDEDAAKNLESIFRASFAPESRLALLYLLQRAAIVNSGGTYIVLPDSIASLVNELAEDPKAEAGENGRIRLSFILTYADSAAPPNGAVNALLLQGGDIATLDATGDPRTVVGRLARLPDLRTASSEHAGLVETIPLRPPGTELVRIWRKSTPRPSDNEVPNEADLDAHLAARFTMLEFELTTQGATLLAFDASLPLSAERAEPTGRSESNPTGWSEKLLEGLGARPENFEKDDLRYDLLVPVGRLAAASPGSDGTPYAAIGKSIQLSFGWRDMYGNRLGGYALTRELLPKYTDPLVPIAAWPGVRSRVYSSGPGSRQLKLELNIDEKVFESKPGSDSRVALLRELQRVIHQLSDPRVSVFVETPLGSLSAPKLPMTVLDGFLRPLRTALMAEGSPPKPWIVAWSIAPDTRKQFLEITLSLVIARPAELVGGAAPGRASRPMPGVDVVRTPLPLSPQDAAARGKPGEARAIANEFRAAFEFEESGHQRRYWVGLGAPGPGQAQWWAIDDRSIPLMSTERPVALAPPPLARALMSAKEIPTCLINPVGSDYSKNLFARAEEENCVVSAVDRDADALLADFLERIETFLSPINAPVTALAAAEGSAPTPFERVAAAKAALLDLVGGNPPLLAGMDTVLEETADAAARKAAEMELRDACSIRLQQFYEVGSVLVKPLESRIENDWITDTGLAAPKLYGQLRFGDATERPLGFRAMTRGIPMAPQRTHLALAVVPEQRDTAIDLAWAGPVAYEITHVERLVEAADDSTRLAPSHWLTIVPLSDKPGRLPAVPLGNAGELIAPLPLRRVPQRPQLDRPTCELYDHDPEPQTYADHVALARRWTYGFDVTAEFDPGDEVCARLVYNAPPGSARVDTRTAGAPRIPGLFEALVVHEAQVSPYWPTIVTEAARRAGVSSATVPQPETRFSNACNRFAEAVERVLEAFRAPPSDAAPVAMPEDRFVLSDAAHNSKRRTSIRFVDHVGSGDDPWSVVAGEGRPWVRIRRIDLAGVRHDGKPSSIGGRHGGLATSPVRGTFEFDGPDDTGLVRKREVQIGRLDALRQQSVWVAASVRRNDKIAGRPANSAFVYRTAEVYLQEVMVPHLKRRRTIAFSPPRTTLNQALLQALIPVFAGIGDRPQPVQVRLDYESGRIVDLLEIVFGEVQEMPSEAFVPQPDPKVMLAGINVVETGSSALALQDLAHALEAGLRAAIGAEPIGRQSDQERGRAVLNLTLRTADKDNVAQPLLQLERVTIDIKQVSDL